jgi:hypothetical protein
MKKLFFIIIIGLSTYGFSGAQELGVRFGDVTVGNAAIDAVFGLGQFSRVHADVSFGDSGVGIDALWDFVYRPLGGEAFNWYAGFGPYLWIDDPFWLGVVGELGLEYRFKNVPIAIGADWRPGFSIIDETGFHTGGFGFNVRYRFGGK